MLIIFQILFTVFSIFVIVNIFKKRREGLLGPKGIFFWTLFWVIANIAVWIPGSTVVLANKLGIGRGADLVLYVSLAIIFFILFRLNVKIESIGRDITKVVRKKAIDEVEK